MTKNYYQQGCCIDGDCTPDNYMDLPKGETCANCVHVKYCCSTFGATPTNTYCGWFPRKFRKLEVTA